MATITRALADMLRNAYQDATFADTALGRQKNIESVLFDIEELQTLIDAVKDNLSPDGEGRKYLKAFLVYRDGYINLCMTGSERRENLANPKIGKPEIDPILNEVVIGLPCPPHCGQANLDPDGLDNKFVTV